MEEIQIFSQTFGLPSAASISLRIGAVFRSSSMAPKVETLT
jgi:hypothetical protein